MLLPTTHRSDIALHPELLMPIDADLSQLMVYRTAGTTGHALLVPHQARAAASYQPLIETALEAYGIALTPGPEYVACFLLGAQAHTVTYACNLSFWEGAGFAKLNMSPSEWPHPGSSQAYLHHFRPQLLTGDPITFAELLKMSLTAQPKALVTTAVAMSPRLKGLLETHFRAPVIDWYSLTETGPIAYACRLGFGYHQLSPDLYIEALDPDGQVVANDAWGEITVSGGRNPFIPLLRYRTGDWGRLDRSPCPCGDPMPRLMELEGRAPVVLKADSGELVNPVDISRVLRQFPLVQHELVQEANRQVRLTVRPVEAGPPPTPDELIHALQGLFGHNTPIQVVVDAALGDRTPSGKVRPYRSMLLEE